MQQWSPDAVARIIRAVRTVERMPRGGAQRRRYVGREDGGAELLIGKLDGALSVGGSATMSVWAWNGSNFADSGDNVTVYDWLLKSGATAISSGKKVVAAKIGDVYVVTDAECQ
ncbi:MAG: hypothetical protein ACOY3P_07055 [Planctomycetota bacterium]